MKYHLIWVTKYRYKVLRGEVALRTRDLLRQICQGREVVIVQGSVSPDHVHMLVSVPPQLAPAKLIQCPTGFQPVVVQGHSRANPLTIGNYFRHGDRGRAAGNR